MVTTRRPVNRSIASNLSMAAMLDARTGRRGQETRLVLSEVADRAMSTVVLDRRL